MVLAGPVHRLGTGKPRRPPVGGTAENAGVAWERVNAENDALRACPSVDRPVPPRLPTHLAGAPAGEYARPATKATEQAAGNPARAQARGGRATG